MMVKLSPWMSSRRLGVKLLDIFPVHEMVEEGLEIIGTPVAVIDIIGMFPNIDAEDRHAAMDERILAIRRFWSRPACRP